MSRHELRLLNGLMAFMVYNANTWPSPFAGHSYVHTGLEKPIRVEIDGQIRNPTPELITHSQGLSHVVLLEIKHRNVDDRQAKGYLAVTESELLGQGFCVAGAQVPNDKDVVYLCDVEDANALTADFHRGNLELPIIAASSEHWYLHSGTFRSLEWNTIFTGGVDVDPYSWPEHFVRVDTDSTVSELAAFMVRDVISLLLAEAEFSVEQICQSSIDLWDQRGQDNQRRLRRAVLEGLNRITQEEFKPFIRRRANAPIFERTSNTPWSAMTLDRISDLTADFIYRQENNIPYRKGQPPLFGYDDVG